MVQTVNLALCLEPPTDHPPGCQGTETSDRDVYQVRASAELHSPAGLPARAATLLSSATGGEKKTDVKSWFLKCIYLFFSPQRSADHPTPPQHQHHQQPRQVRFTASEVISSPPPLTHLIHHTADESLPPPRPPSLCLGYFSLTLPDL